MRGSTYLKVWIGQCKPFSVLGRTYIVEEAHTSVCVYIPLWVMFIPTVCPAALVYCSHFSLCIHSTVSHVYTYCVSGCTCLLHSNLWPNSSHGSHVHHLNAQHCQYYPWNKLSTPKYFFTKNAFYLTFSIGYSIITLSWAHFTAQWENNPSGVTWTYSQLAQYFNRSLENMKSLFHEEGSWSQPVGPLHCSMC